MREQIYMPKSKQLCFILKRMRFICMRMTTYNVTCVHSQQKSKCSISGSDQPPSFSFQLFCPKKPNMKSVRRCH